jgi:6-pyruvoyltetrahydropterin/6-carboxytetrahydropterin synthase
MSTVESGSLERGIMGVNDCINITRVVGFCAAHRYHSEQLSEDENRRVFGKCNRPHGHGHNYRLEVTVAGSVDPVTGMVMNLADLDRILREVVVGPLDHSFLNFDVPHFADTVPTCENIVLWLLGELEGPLGALGVELRSLRLHESDDLFAEVVR